LATELISLLAERARLATIVPPEPRRPITLPVSDDDENPEPTAPIETTRDCRGLAFQIRYVDSRGEESSRRITVRRLATKSDDVLIYAYCHERRAPRCFASSRISEMIDVATGEVIGDPSSHFSLFVAPSDASELPTTETIARIQDAATVLVFLARADGRLDVAETRAIAGRIVALVGGRHEELIDTVIARLYPDSWSALDAFERMIGSSRIEDLIDVLEFLPTLAAIDGVVSDAERAFVRECAVLLNGHGFNVRA
jgi:predicted DNA-binding transcriptional regulator YafY